MSRVKEHWYVYGVVSIVAMFLTYHAFMNYGEFLHPDQATSRQKNFFLFFYLIDRLGGKWLVLGIMLILDFYLMVKMLTGLGWLKSTNQTAPASETSADLQKNISETDTPEVERTRPIMVQQRLVPVVTDNAGHPTIELLGAIEKFYFQTPVGEIFSSSISVQHEFRVSKRTEDFLIFFELENRRIALNVMREGQPLFWQHFDNNSLQQIAAAFGLDVREVKRSPEPNLSIRIPGPIGGPFGFLGCVPDGVSDCHYIFIFDYEFPERTSLGLLYVHGIWRVRLSGEVKQCLERGYRD